MKKIFIIFAFIVCCFTSGAFAADNSLNAVILEETPKGYNVVLRSDRVAPVKKVVKSNGVLNIDLKNISTALNLDTKYINTKNVNNMIVENLPNNMVKIFIQAEGIENADIIFDTPASTPVVVSDNLSNKQIGWIAAAFLLICFMAGSFKKSVEADEKISLHNDLTEREIKLYRELKSDILTDAEIDNRLRKHLAAKRSAKMNFQGVTIRSLQKTASK